MWTLRRKIIISALRRRNKHLNIFWGGLVMLASLQVNIKSWAEELHQEPNAAFEERRRGRRTTGVSEVVWWMEEDNCPPECRWRAIKSDPLPKLPHQACRGERVACNPELQGYRGRLCSVAG